MESTGPFPAEPAAPPPQAPPAPSAELLAAGEAAAEAASRFCMSFRVGPLGFLFPSDDGREVVAPPAVSRVPNTAAWLRGLANVRGELVPVVDAARAFGVPREARVPTYLLIFGQGESTLGLLIDGLPRLFNLGLAAALPQLPDVPALLRECVSAAYEHADRTWFDLDLDMLFDTFARHAQG